MRRPPYHRDERDRLDVKMTPMIDVIFLLLIFFVCTASFRASEEVLPTSLSLPGAIDSVVPTEPELEDLDEIVVKVSWEEGRVACRINRGEPRGLGAVRAVLVAIARRVKADVPVILDVDGVVPMEGVIDVYDLCRQAGLEKVRFAASPENIAGPKSRSEGSDVAPK